MKITNGYILAFAAIRRVRTVLFLFGVWLAGSTLWSAFPGPFSFLLLIILLLVTVGSLIVALCQAGSALFAKRWQLFGERLILLVFAVPIMIISLPLGDYVHLAFLYPYYREKIAQTSKRPVRFVWGDQAVSVLDGYQMQTLLYDDTGATTAITKPVRDKDLLCTYRLHLTGNFYIEHVTDDPC